MAVLLYRCKSFFYLLKNLCKSLDPLVQVFHLFEHARSTGIQLRKLFPLNPDLRIDSLETCKGLVNHFSFLIDLGQTLF